MALSKDLISQFVKITNDDKKIKGETFVYGTIVEYKGDKYVQLDGSELLTPISTTTDTKAGERVTVMIKNHSATVTGNVSSPSARSDDVNAVKQTVDELNVEELVNKISEFEIIVADKVSSDELDAERARIDELRAEDVVIKESLTAAEADIDNLQASSLTITDQLTAAEANISKLETEKMDVVIADAKFATIDDLEATNVDVHNLEATYGDFSSLTTDRLNAIDAALADLEVEDLNARYANIDFSNITNAAIENFYSNSGLIEDIVVGDGTITGRLVGVTISGDLIEANTVVAEKLVVKGEDGIYYKLNIDGETVEANQTDQNSLNGSVIKAKSITATKISVDDLVAFDATIGGFNITDSSIYSGVKDSVDNTTNGTYFDKEGQMVIGDSSKYVKYYKDSEGNYKLIISADSIIFSSTNDSVESVIDELQISMEEQYALSESIIQQISDSISSLVTDGNGTSLMTQTETGWEFSTSEIQKSIDAISENLDSLVNEFGDVDIAIDILKQAVDDLGVISEYVKIGTYEDEPCIELGESDSDFKLLITNTRMLFMEGSNIIAYITNQSLHINKAIIEEELQQGGFVWKVRSNGNMGLSWKGVGN